LTHGSVIKFAISSSSVKSTDAQKFAAILIRIWEELVIQKASTVALLCVIRSFLAVSTTVRIFATWVTANLANGFQSSLSTVLAILLSLTHQSNVVNHYLHVVVHVRRSYHVATIAE
jgi:hypothetical protein